MLRKTAHSILCFVEAEWINMQNVAGTVLLLDDSASIKRRERLFIVVYANIIFLLVIWI